MIHNVYILRRDGLCVLHRKYGSLEVDENLVSGFLSALSDFGKNISGKDLESVIFDDKKFVSLPSEHLIVVSYCDTNDDVVNVLKDIRDAFTQSYGSLQWWNGERGAFQEFLSKLDEIVGRKGKEEIDYRNETEQIFNELKEGKISAKDAVERTLEYYFKKSYKSGK
ncbi:MAG: hypothetical protein KIH08_02470 [Candidatus Freyarchaeota archaeon]|nr:hypothetical protein [Candidatus Jordarchaeia archaeon]MBS7268011.1 hypothetical protein [Candidatus Jordarchaeia archaeon]MBS7278372.1 hypothetical protein [Candidatus Jordarchaeia archaeon]